MPLLQPNIIFAGRYTLIEKLGIGGYSEVWKATDNMAGEMLVALKIFAPDKGLDQNGIQVFSKEYGLVFNLYHANLLKPSHYDIWEGSPYLVMPYCKNGSLYGKIGEMSETEALSFIQQAADALDYLHSQPTPIIHQDIKPDNFLINDSGNYLLSDFGISSRLRRTLTRSIGNIGSSGTMAYLPPERFSEDKQILPAGDIFALGVTIYEILTGDLPFDEQGGLRLRNGAGIPKLPSSFNPKLNDLVRSCLNADPALRPDARALRIKAAELLNSQKGVVKPSQTKQPSEVRKTVQIPVPVPHVLPVPPKVADNPKKSNIWPLIMGIFLLLGGFALVIVLRTNTTSQNEKTAKAFADSVALADSIALAQLEFAKQNSLIIDPVKMQRLRDSMSIAQKEVSEQIALNGSNEKSIKDKIPHQEEYTNTDHPNLPKTNTQLSIGEQFAGGIIFYIDNTGKHGLVCAAYDQSKSISWYNGTFVSTNAKGAKIGTGKTNTNKIVKSQGSGNYAAGICQDLILNGYSDWYLPSIDELVLMYENLKVPGKSNFADAGYWSSSEIDKENAYEKGFGYGYTYSNGKYSEFCVRAIRSF